MPNEFDNQVAPAGNEYDAIANQMANGNKEQTGFAVREAAYAARAMSPDQAARVDKLARQSRLDAGLVERNQQKVEQDLSVAANDYDAIIENTPKFASFIAKSKLNAALTKDDVDAISQLEDATNRHAYFNDLGRAIGSGALNMLSGLAKLPALAANYVPGPEVLQGDIDFQMARAEANSTPVPEGLYKNAVTNFLDEKAKALAFTDSDLNLTEAFTGGEKARGLRALSLQIVTNLPQLGMLAATRGAGLPLMFATSAGGKMAENLEAGVDADTARLSALGHATIETGIEAIGGVGGSAPLKATISQLAKDLGPKATKDILVASMKQVLKTGLEEGGEELVTSIGQDLLDYGLDINPDGLKGIGTRALNSFLVGAGSGVAISTPAQLSNFKTTFQKDQKTEGTAATLQEVSQAYDNVKLKDRSPPSMVELLRDQTQGTPLEKVYMPVSDMDQLFQSKGMSPSEMANQLGLLDEYKKASESGTDLQISFPEFMVKAKELGIFDDMIPDMKLDPADDTPRQRQTEKQLAREELQAQERQVREADQAFEGAGKQVQKNLQAQLEATGATRAEAVAQSTLFAETFKSFGSRSGASAADFLDRYGLRFENAVEGQEAAMGQGILNQVALDQMKSSKPDVMNQLQELYPVTGDVAVDDAAFAELQKDAPKYKEYLSLLDQLGTREERAKAMGFGNRTWYHGTTVDIPSFQREALGLSTGAQSAKKGFFFASDPSTASDYAELAREKGVIREGDKVTTKWLSEAEVPDPVSMQDAQRAMDNWRSLEYAETYNKNIKKGLADWQKIKESPTKEKEWASAAKRDGMSVDEWIDSKIEKIKSREVPIPTREEIDAAKDEYFRTYEEFASHNPGLAKKIHSIERKNMSPENQKRLDKAFADGLEREASGGQNVGSYRLKGDKKTIHRKDYKGADYRDSTYSDEMTAAQEAGKSAVLFKNTFDPGDPNNRVEQDIAAVFDPEQIRSTMAAFDPRRAASAQVLAQGDETHRGQIDLRDRSNIVISLFKAKNASTVLHEGGHLFLEIMGDLAETNNVAQSLKDDYDGVKKWLGVESRDQIGVEQHEKFARGFEQWLREGKAPTQVLKRAFASFKNWLTRIYPFAEQLNAELTPEVREIFSRMVTADAQVTQAQEVMAQTPLFENLRTLGMSEDQATKYEQAVGDAKEKADTAIRVELMEDLARRDEKFYKEQEATLREEIKAELNDTRDYRAINVLQGKADLNTVPLLSGVTELKISKRSIIDMFGKDAVKEFPRGTTSTDGAHIESAAILLDYADANQLAEALRNKPPIKEAVEARVKEEMDQRYPDRMNDPELSERAVEAVHSDERARVIKMEAEFLRDLAPTASKNLAERLIRRMNSKVLREEAQATVADLPIRDMRPHVYRAAEVRAAKAAARAYGKGDFSEAIEQKRLEALNHELFRAATENRQFVDKELQKLKRFDKSDEDLAKSRDMDIIVTARAVMAQFGIGSETKTPEEALRQMKAYDLDAYITTMRHIDAAVEGIDNPTGEFKDLKFKDFSNLIDQTNALWDFAKSSREITREGQKFDRDQLIEQAVVKLTPYFEGKQLPGVERAVTPMEQAKGYISDFLNGYRRVEHLAYLLDGGDSRGPVTELLVRGIQEAQTQFHLKQEQMKERLDQIVESVAKEEQREIRSDELGYTFQGVKEVMGLMTHMGNASNLQKLLLGGRGVTGQVWGTLNEDGTLDRSRLDAFMNRMYSEGVIKEHHWKVVQDIWDLHDELKVDAQKAHKKLTGRYFDEITANSFQTPFGEMRGGYVAALTDPNLVAETNSNLDQELAGLTLSFMMPTKGDGFTKARVDGYNKPLLLDLTRAHSSMSKVLRFTYLQPAVQEAARVVKDYRFSEAVNRMDPTVIPGVIVPMLNRASLQRKTEPMGPRWRVIEKTMNTLRRNASIQFLGANMKNVTENFAGLSSVATRVPVKHLMMAVKNNIRNGGATTLFIINNSDYMRSRIGKNREAIQSAFDEFQDPSKFKKVQDVTTSYAMIFDKLTNHAVEKAAWLGAYNHAIEKGFSEADARFDADGVVRQTLADAGAASVSGFEAGNALTQMFTMFSTFFNTQYNMQLTNTQLAKQYGLTSGKGSRLLIQSVIFGFYAQGVFGELVKRFWAGQNLGDADDDGEYLDDVMQYFLEAPARYATAMLPLGAFANYAMNLLNDKPYDDSFQKGLSPALGTVDTAGSLVKTIPQALEGKNQSKALRDMLMMAGLITGLPFGVAAKPLSYLADVDEGKARPSGGFDIARGVLTGKPGGPAK